MRSYVMTLCRIVTIAFIAVSIHAQCLDTMPVIERGPIAPDGNVIAGQCQEACTTFGTTPKFDRHWEDPWYLDWITIGCYASDGTRVGGTDVASTNTCWKCVEGCAGSACPPGETCLPRPNWGGSDCHRYACADPVNYMVVENTQTGVPECRRREPCSPPSCTTATVVLNGPTKIQPGATCMWTAEIQSQCPSSDYIYHWYAGPQWVGSGPSYTGGKPSGVLNGYPWRVRVEIVYNGALVASDEIQVSESANAMACFY